MRLKQGRPRPCKVRKMWYTADQRKDSVSIKPARIFIDSSRRRVLKNMTRILMPSGFRRMLEWSIQMLLPITAGKNNPKNWGSRQQALSNCINKSSILIYAEVAASLLIRKRRFKITRIGILPKASRKKIDYREQGPSS